MTRDHSIRTAVVNNASETGAASESNPASRVWRELRELQGKRGLEDSSESAETPFAPNTPPAPRDIDMRIARDGVWYYHGTPIRRPALVRLFASVLQREADDCYYLVTKFEKCRIRVDDAPFIATALEVRGQSERQSLCFTLNTGDTVVAGTQRPLRMASYAKSGAAPYLLVRERLEARVSRSVYYELAEVGEMQVSDGKTWLCLHSDGARFRLGAPPESAESA